MSSADPDRKLESFTSINAVLIGVACKAALHGRFSDHEAGENAARWSAVAKYAHLEILVSMPRI